MTTTVGFFQTDHDGRVGESEVCPLHRPLHLPEALGSLSVLVPSLLPLPKIGFSLLSTLCLIRSPDPRTSFPMPSRVSARLSPDMLLSPVKLPN